MAFPSLHRDDERIADTRHVVSDITERRHFKPRLCVHDAPQQREGDEGAGRLDRRRDHSQDGEQSQLSGVIRAEQRAGLAKGLHGSVLIMGTAGVRRKVSPSGVAVVRAAACLRCGAVEMAFPSLHRDDEREKRIVVQKLIGREFLDG
jgi:hypothetical protein